jgi:hypothetical protein
MEAVRMAWHGEGDNDLGQVAKLIAILGLPIYIFGSGISY